MGALMAAFETPAPVSLTLELPYGDARISATERDSTVVDVRPSDASNKTDVKAADQTRVELADGRLLVKVPRPRGWHRGGGGSVDVTIELPAGSHLNGTIGWGDLRCDGPLGDCRVRSGLGPVLLDEVATLRVKSGAGDVSAERVAGKAEVTTGTGEVRLGDVGGVAVVKNSNGNTSVGAVAGDLRVHTANGNIAVESAGASVVAKSANGDVRVGEVARGTVDLQTSTGHVEVGIREGTAALLDVRSGYGRIHNALETSEGPGQSDEVAEIRARTSFGDIAIRRSAPQE
jgi:DUF4097 and DUF4098 domain-containing protein YvlB